MAQKSKPVEIKDVRADDPEHAMEHFNEGLRRVLLAPKSLKTRKPLHKRKRASR